MRIGGGNWAALRPLVDAARTRAAGAEHQPSYGMCRLLVLGEDHRIARHPGVDPFALCRALWRTYARGRREGGSTVAMQLVRVLTGRFERSWRRKASEIVLAIRLTRYLPPGELPALYLSVGYYGWRMSGFVEACQRLSIDPRRCSLREAAMLVARLKYPEPRVCSARRRSLILKRSEYLMGRLKNHGWHS